MSRVQRARASLRQRLGAAFAVGVLLVLLSGLAGVLGVTATANSVAELVERVQPEQLANAQLRTSVIEASRGVRGYLATGEPRFLEAYERGRRDYPVALARLQGLAGAEEVALVGQQARLADAWFELFATPSQRPPGSDAEVDVLLANGKALLDDFQAGNDRLARQVELTAGELQRRSATTRRALQATLGAVGLAGVVLVAGIGVRTTRAVVGPLAGLRDTLGKLAGGDLTARVQGVDRAPAEVQAVATSVNLLAAESERLRRGEHERARMRELARAAGLRIRQHLDMDSVLREAVDAIGPALRADRVHVRRIVDGQLAPVSRQWAASGVAPLRLDQAPTSWPLPGDPVAWARELRATGRSYVVADTGTEPSLQTPVARAHLAGTGTRSLILVPLGAGDELYALLTVTSVRDVRAWTAPEVELAEAVAADAGLALHHARLYQQQQELVEQLRELDKTKSDFLSTVSHELRTPLTSISGYVELIRDGDVGPVTGEQEHMLDVVDRNTSRLKRLIEDLLTLSRIEAGAFRLTLAPVEVAELVTAAADTVRPAAASAGLTFVVAPGPPGLRVSGDQGQLERVLLNLLSNAIKFSPDGGTVSLRACPAPVDDGTGPGLVCLTVTDTGIGIPEEDQQRLFGRFFRATNATARAIQGTGLGLTIVRSIVEQHGGHLELRSAVGQGTTVEIVLPALPGDHPG